MKSESPLIHILKAFLPYSRQNLLFTYKPRQFYAELARTSGCSEGSLTAAYKRAQASHLIQPGPSPTLTLRGRQKLQPFVAHKLTNEGKLLVIFDIPESLGPRRRQFRRILQELDFDQVQQSVWISSYDHREIITETVQVLALESCVQMYEAARLPS
jgi:hypothetical protein